MKLGGLLTVCTLLATTGCRFEHHETRTDSNNVKFATPFGGLNVKTDAKSAQTGIGLTQYPGAVLSTKNNEGKEDGVADVNLSFGGLHLGIKALKYQSADAPQKVIAFYRQDMAKYGKVILCHGHSPVGQPDRTQDGLTCDSDGGNSKTIEIDGDSGQDKLKAGSRQHQHIVSMEPHNGGTKIALVMLDLPGNMGGDDSKD